MSEKTLETKKYPRVPPNMTGAVTLYAGVRGRYKKNSAWRKLRARRSPHHRHFNTCYPENWREPRTHVFLDGDIGGWRVDAGSDMQWARTAVAIARTIISWCCVFVCTRLWEGQEPLNSQICTQKHVIYSLRGWRGIESPHHLAYARSMSMPVLATCSNRC